MSRLAERARAHAGLWCPGLAALLHLGLGFVFFASSGPDDVHITYGAAANLAKHGAITNYNGDALEQSSSLGHVVLTALFARLTGLSVVTVGHVIPILAGALCFPLVYALAREVVPKAPVATTLFVACIPQSVDWTFGGLEGPIFALSTLLSAKTASDYLKRGGPRALALLVLSLTLTAVTRPEGMLVSVMAASAVVAIAVRRARASGALTLDAVRPEVSVLGAALVAGLVTTAAHLAIGGHMFPNPVLAKSRGVAFVQGLTYFWDSMPWTWAWTALAFLAGVDAVVAGLKEPRGERAAEQMVAIFSVSYLAFILASGGDWMWGGRFFANVAPLLGLMIVAGVVRVAPPTLLGGPLTAALLLGCVPATFAVVGGTRTGRPFWTVPSMRALVRERYPNADYGWFELASGVCLRDIPVTESLSGVLDRIAPFKSAGPILVASRQSGFTIYHAVERPHPNVHFIDLENLATDDYLACADRFLTRDTKGALLSVEALLRPPSELANRCHPSRPDVIFGASHGADVKAATSAGYVLVFRQRGRVGAEPWTAGHYSAFIAVDAGLAAAAKLEPTLDDPLDFDWADACSLLLHRLP